MADPDVVKRLERMATICRRDFVLNSSGHGGGVMSMMDIAVALYFHHMNHDPANPDWEERDRLILGKAHCAGALYSVLGEAGYFPKEKWFVNYGGTKFPDSYVTLLQGHAEGWCTPGIDYSGGSLGQGLGFACGLAVGARIKAERIMYGAKDPWGFPETRYRVFCITGDGESHEGSVWESAMFAGHYELDNLINIVDFNKYCVSGPVSERMGLTPMAEKWRSFGWHVTEIDGHNMGQIVDTLALVDNVSARPKCIIAHTVKGKGIPKWERSHVHGGALTPDELHEALETYLKVE